VDLMLWKEVQSWASARNYKVKKIDIGYSWSRIEDTSKFGTSKSVSKLATDIYNDMTDNKWLEYQKYYEQNCTNIVI
jgi:hypothetical protein